MPAPAARRRFRTLTCRACWQAALVELQSSVPSDRIHGLVSLFTGHHLELIAAVRFGALVALSRPKSMPGVTQPLAFEDQHAQAYNESGTTQFQSPQVVQTAR